MAVHRGADLRFGRAGASRQQLGTLDDHAVGAVAAMRRLLIDESLLQRVQRRRRCEALLLGVPGRKAFERRHRLASHGRNGRLARAHLDTVEKHRA
jgi:hypothetical protein